MASILSLPPETIYEIGLQLESSDNRNLRLTCHQICVAVESLALSKLFIDINKDSLHVTLGQLKEFATRSTRSIDYIRTVVVYNSLKSDQEHRDGHSPDIPLFAEDIQTLHSHFSSLVTSNVRSLLWFTNPADSGQFMNIVIQYATRQCITDFSLDLTAGCHPLFPVALLSMQNLEKLHYKTTSKLNRNLLFMMSRALSKVIRRSPHLSHLAIDTGHFLASTDAPSLHDILPAISEEPPIPMKTLSLRNLRTLLDESTLHHLRSLESLSIHFNLPTPTNGSLMPQIWNTLRTESIHLTRVDVNLTDVDDAFLDYLLSCKDLRELILDNSARLWSRNQLNAVGHRFFGEVLPKISGPLEVLHIETICLGAWCFGELNASAIAQCKELRELTVSIVDTIQIHSQATLVLLDQTTSQLPKLHYLRKVDVSTVPQIG
ncbi:hypothetical protein GALMADRAFT_254552 [Galerina marginata CBS 339.88]|uniref:F-box domain-containing protein n=1 Tax=Galerina marginata (strain CBS 339.88) TaxID=685588 RepID=A0A067SJ58_GALM3|nr:hypothetical protein GALMADRAFT_254552 [Galerina marginata CBS 339.88]